MKIYGDPTSNLIRNSVPSSTFEFTSFSEGLPITSFTYQSGINGAGEDGYVRYLSNNGGTVTGFMGFIYGVGHTAVAKPGDKMTFSIYIRPSVTTSLQLQFEGREALMGVNVGWSMASSNNALTVCPANVWTRLSVVGTVNTVVNGPGYVTPRPYLRGSSGTVYPAGFTYDISSLMLTRGDTLINYFNGNTAGCSWTAGANVSVSVKNNNFQYYTPPDVFVSEPAYNEILNPRFFGGTTLSPLWASHVVGTSAGTYSTATTSQTVTATSISAGGSFGVYATDSGGNELIPLYAPILAGSNITSRVSVNKSGLAAGTTVNMRTEFYGADGTTLVGTNLQTSTIPTGSQFLSGAVLAISANAHYVKYYLYIAAAANFTGSSSVIFSSAGVIWMFNYGYGVSIAGDGVFTGYSGGNSFYSPGVWLGTPDASKSSVVIRFAKEVTPKIQVRSRVVNEITNSRLVGTGAVANNFITYSNSGGTDVGTRTAIDNTQRINLTSITAGLYRYGVSTPTAVTMNKPIKAGTPIRAGYTVDMTNSSGLRAGVLLTLYYSDGTNTSSAPATDHITGTGASMSVGLVVNPPKDVIRYTFYMYIAPTAPFTGNATIICKDPYVIGDPMPGTPTGYFNGSSGAVGTLGTAQWSGTVDNSPSIIPYWAAG